MPSFGKKSKSKLDTVHSDIRRVMEIAIQHVDFTVIYGHRSKQEQDALYAEGGKTQVKFPNSKHNSLPARAIDIAPYPIDWANHKRFTYLAGIIMGIAASEGVKMRWGGDWDMDNNPANETFWDAGHFELI